MDWGWFPDPWAFNSCGYDAARRVLYIFDEATRRRTSNADTARILLEKGVCAEDSETLIADSAEEKSCRDYRSMGLPCRGAEKGPGSVKAGMKWLQSLAEIRIDPARCPDTAKEISEEFHVTGRRSASLLDIFTSVGQGLIPYGAQLLSAASLTGLTPFEIIPYLYYPVLMGISAILFIVFMKAE